MTTALAAPLMEELLVDNLDIVEAKLVSVCVYIYTLKVYSSQVASYCQLTGKILKLFLLHV